MMCAATRRARLATFALILAVIVIGLTIYKHIFRSTILNDNVTSKSNDLYDTPNSVLNIVDVTSFRRDLDIQCIKTRTRPVFKICVHDPKIDRVISRRLVENGYWEILITNIMKRVLDAHPNSTFVDIGANIGYYSLLAATSGHTVVAVEPDGKNVERFQKSISENKLWNRITLLKNAISDTYTIVEMTVQAKNPGNIFISLKGSEETNHDAVKTATLDDVRRLIWSEVAIIKIDIENHECHAFKKAFTLFRDLYIPYIFMEWTFPLKSPPNVFRCNVTEANVLKGILIEMDYRPYMPQGNVPIPLDPISDFEPKLRKSRDVIWVHKRETLFDTPS